MSYATKCWCFLVLQQQSGLVTESQPLYDSHIYPVAYWDCASDVMASSELVLKSQHLGLSWINSVTSWEWVFNVRALSE